MQWLITYITRNNENAPRYNITVTAATYTKALLNFMLLNINNAIAIEIKKI